MAMTSSQRLSGWGQALRVGTLSASQAGSPAPTILHAEITPLPIVREPLAGPLEEECRAFRCSFSGRGQAPPLPYAEITSSPIALERASDCGMAGHTVPWRGRP